MEKETQKRDFLINYWLGKTSNCSNSTEGGGGKEVEGFIGEGGGELNITHGV
jgi:hypothetical protein